MKILVVNAGSSSLKYQLFDMDTQEVLAKGLCERIGIDGIVTHKRPGKEDYKATPAFPTTRRQSNAYCLCSRIRIWALSQA